MRILVIGGSGLVGSHICGEATSRGHEVVGTFRTERQKGLVHFDLDSANSETRILDEVKPDCVIHSAGWTWVDGCEHDPTKALRENCIQPARLARACYLQGIRFAYISSTYVFDGCDGPYSEEASARPINVYGDSKLAGEKAIIDATNGEAIIARTICVWGVEAKRKNFVYQMIEALRKGTRLYIPSDQLGNPTWAGDLAYWLVRLCEASERGIWNLAGSTLSVSRVQWLTAIHESLGKDPRFKGKSTLNYVACSTSDLRQPARRPLQASAIIKKILRRYPRSCRHFSDIGPVLDAIGKSERTSRFRPKP
jgi:dTDP-4-dehydrorhamnose reductase